MSKTILFYTNIVKSFDNPCMAQFSEQKGSKLVNANNSITSPKGPMIDNFSDFTGLKQVGQYS